jgi:hypothetical protein
MMVLTHTSVDKQALLYIDLYPWSSKFKMYESGVVVHTVIPALKDCKFEASPTARPCFKNPHKMLENEKH